MIAVLSDNTDMNDDEQYGIDTIGFLAANEITADKDLSSRIVCYDGSQPSIVRKALAALGGIEDYTLLDLGCGKGRATVAGPFFLAGCAIGCGD